MSIYPHHSFFSYFIFFSFLFSFLISLFNYLVDPFDIFQFTKIPKVNAVKIQVHNQQRMFKAIEIFRQKPDALFLGSSRVGAGLDPSYFNEKGYHNVYNAAFNGANFEEIFHYFEHALYHQPQLKLVIIGLDLFAFSTQKKIIDSLTTENLKEKTMNRLYQLTILMNKNTLMNSYLTWKENACKELSNPFLVNGQYNPQLVFKNTSHVGLEEDLNYVKSLFSKLGNYDRFQLDDYKIHLFQQLVEKCRTKGIELKIFFCPTKAIYWETLYRKQLWNQLEDLKRRLSAIYPLWDFSGFNCITTESIVNEINQPIYYECSHFQTIVGNWILDFLFGQFPIKRRFGYYITFENIEETLSKILEDRAKWLSTEPKALEQLNLVFPPN